MLLVAAILSRIVFGLWFAPAGLSAADWAGALWLGARFDARVAVLSVGAVWLLGALPWLGPRIRPSHARGLWWACWMIAAALWGAAAIFDAGHYAYLAQRLSAVVFSLARDTGEAAGMVWQSYPVIWIVLGFLLWMLLCHWVFVQLWLRLAHAPAMRLRNARIAETVVVLLAVFVVHGKLSQYPLRWSDAVELPHSFAQSLALNPLQSLSDSWSFRAQRLDDAQMRPDADAIRAFVGLPPLKPGEPISFLRTVPPKPGAEPVNVVLVLLESFAAHKTGVLGNPLGATPSFDALAREGLLFTRMMSAHSHTARGVFATVTGMPDVSAQSTASRNPAATNQHTIVNEFKGHQKFYFIGGSTSWANVRGVLTANIDGIEIYEQGRLKSPTVDVWGVSDKNVFFEANELFREQKTPFFAIIQTSGNHRPYSIPDEDLKLGFAPPAPSEAELKAQGFISLAEYRAFAYLDWCVGQFMQRAKKEAYFKNTVFAFIGDHGIIGPTGPHLPRAWQELAITQGHTPLLVYSPGRVPARRVESWAQQVDVLPTLASIAGIGYRNTTLGRDLLDAQFDATRVAFEFQFTGPGELGVMVGQHMLIDRKPVAAYDILSDKPGQNLLAQTPVPAELQQLVQTWGRFPTAYGNASLYLQTHNPRFRD
ncbi:MAG: sulfatase-like hydrolase/transferase [Rhizobacter sp.]|nr:sulfatase-like hydrolase/transferase [Rhizobacter sp.]